MKIDMKMKICKTGMILAGIVFLLNAFDGFATIRLWRYGNGFFEVNPMMRFFLNSMGEWMLIPKLAFGVIAATLIAVWWTIRQDIKTLEIRIIKLSILGVVVIYLIIDLYQGFLLCV